MKKSRTVIIISSILSIALISSLLMAVVYLLTPKSQAENVITLVLGIGSIVVPFLLAIPIYYLLRKRGFNTKSEVTTTLVVSFGLTISSLFHDIFLTSWFLDRVSPVSFVVGATITGFIITFLLSLAGSAVASKLYKRKHSLIAD